MPETHRVLSNADGGNECGCYACIGDKPAYEGSWLTVGMSMMILCALCGNKRCPHGTDHRNPCTASNEPNQPGSRYHHAALATSPTHDGAAAQEEDHDA